MLKLAAKHSGSDGCMIHFPMWGHFSNDLRYLKCVSWDKWWLTPC